MASTLLLTLTEQTYLLTYKDGEETLLEAKMKYGLRKLEDYKLRERASFLLLDPLLHMLEKISLYERIPTTLYVITEKHSAWIGHTLKEYPYTQFYTTGRAMSVILLRAHSTQYAGHTQKTFKFKI